MTAGVQKIYINGRFLGRPVTGVERFGREILRALDDLIAEGGLKQLHFVLLIPRGVHVELLFKNIEVREVGRRGGYFWEQLELLVHTKDGFLVNLCNTAPVLKSHQAVVIHDAGVFSAPHSFSWKFRTAYKLMHRALCLGGSTVMSVSNFSKEDLVKNLPLTASRVHVVSEGSEHIRSLLPDDGILSKENLAGQPYYLAVSSMAPHKNFRVILDALEKLPSGAVRVAIAGGNNSKVFGDTRAHNAGNVHWLGYVSDRELKSLYSNAIGFIFPSIYEGFGIPPLEAMQCGCPVIAARSASLPEVCGEAALYFDPNDASELASQMVLLQNDAALHGRLVSLGHTRANSFSWRKAALEMAAACNWVPKGDHG